MKKNFFILLSCLLLAACCDFSAKSASIKAIYFCGTGDHPTTISKEVFLNYDSNNYDTIHISKEDMDSIYSYASNGLLDTLKDESDIRIYLQIGNRNYMIGDESKMIGQENVISLSSLYAQYFIKNKIGFYNYIEKDRLYDFKEIRIWGIPNDYHHYGGPVNKPKRGMCSLILLEK